MKSHYSCQAANGFHAKITADTYYSSWKLLAVSLVQVIPGNIKVKNMIHRENITMSPYLKISENFL